MAKTKDMKKQLDEIYERNRREAERVWRLVEVEGIAKKGAAEVLREFAQNGFPSTLEGMIRMLAPLRARYGLPKTGSSIYPDPPSPIPPDWKKFGMRWSFEFPNGQIISAV